MKKLVVVLLAAVSVPVMAQDRIAKFDVDGDKKVDYVELTSHCEVSKGLFEKADKNGDGVLSNSEMKTAKAYLFNRCKKESRDA